MNYFCLDTCTWIYIANGTEPVKFLENLLDEINSGNLVIILPKIVLDEWDRNKIDGSIMDGVKRTFENINKSIKDISVIIDKIDYTLKGLVPYINNINIEKENIENDTTPKNDIVVKLTKKKAKVIEAEGKKVAGEKTIQKETCADGANNIPPPPENVRSYFLSQNSTETEAQKFYNYFQSNGWKVGGKTPMKDWQAAARNWILNTSQFAQQRHAVQPQSHNLQATTGKNYSEPL